MPKPSPYAAKVAVPLPPDGVVRAAVGPSYDPAAALNVVEMFAGTGDMFEAAMGFGKAGFEAEGIDPRGREAIILRAAKVLDAPTNGRPTKPWRPTSGCPPARSIGSKTSPFG